LKYDRAIRVATGWPRRAPDSLPGRGRLGVDSDRRSTQRCALNDLRYLVAHKPEVAYPIMLKFRREFTHKAEFSPSRAR
jgi:hypothetical protein